MKTKQDIVKNWLPRYTGRTLEQFDQYILLTNFNYYVELFADKFNAKLLNNVNMPNASAQGITIINFGMGSPNAATIMDLLSAVSPQAVLFLGKCGGLKDKYKVGDLVLPTAAIRNEGTSNEYMPLEVPALPAFSLQRAVSSTIRKYNKDYWTGTVFTTNKRVWEHDDNLKKYLMITRPTAIDMETATIFTVGFYNNIPTGSLLLISDQPMISTGVKTIQSDKDVDNSYVDLHLNIGIKSLLEIKNNGISVKHLKY